MSKLKILIIFLWSSLLFISSGFSESRISDNTLRIPAAFSQKPELTKEELKLIEKEVEFKPFLLDPRLSYLKRHILESGSHRTITYYNPQNPKQYIAFDIYTTEMNSVDWFMASVSWYDGSKRIELFLERTTQDSKGEQALIKMAFEFMMSLPSLSDWANTAIINNLSQDAKDLLKKQPEYEPFFVDPILIDLPKSVSVKETDISQEIEIKYGNPLKKDEWITFSIGAYDTRDFEIYDILVYDSFKNVIYSVRLHKQIDIPKHVDSAFKALKAKVVSNGWVSKDIPAISKQPTTGI